MKKYLDPKNLPYFGALVQAVLFAIAGNEHFAVAGWLVGLGVGVIVNWSIALASSRVSEVAKNRKILSYLSLGLLLCLSPVIICSTLGWSVAHFAWSVASDLSIVLTGSIVGKSLIPAQKVAQQKPANAKVAGSVAKGRSAKKQRRSAIAPADIWRCECGAEFTNRYKYSGHAGKCAVHKNGKLIPVGVVGENSRNTQEVSRTPRST